MCICTVSKQNANILRAYLNKKLVCKSVNKVVNFFHSPLFYGYEIKGSRTKHYFLKKIVITIKLIKLAFFIVNLSLLVKSLFSISTASNIKKDEKLKRKIDYLPHELLEP